MTQVVYPSLRLSANGAAALLDTVERGYRVCDLPSGAVRWDLSAEGDLSHLSLSASGNAVAWLGENADVSILTEAGKKTVILPATGDRIRAIAPADTAACIAALIAAGSKDAPDGGRARLVIVPGRPDDDAPTVAGIPVYDRGFLLANDDCSLLAVESSSNLGDRTFGGAYARDGDTLRSLWTEQPAPVPHGALALYGEWLFAATADGLAGWRRSGDRVSLPGTMREQLIFSRDGRYLLAFRVEEVVEVTSARTLVRLIDRESLKEVRRATHLIADRHDAHFALDADFGLFEVRATKSGDLAAKKLDWHSS